MIFDCFLFFNELDLLEIRLNVLNDSVDRFVLVESTLTFQGKPKELHYQINKDRFVKFQHKIIHIIVDTFPSNFVTAWESEWFQRNEIKRGLVSCQPNDVILVSDIDEIPNPKSIENALQIRGIKIFQQKAFYNFLNCAASIDGAKLKYWNGPIMVLFKQYTSAQELRGIVIRSMKLNNALTIKRIAHKIFFTFSNLLAFRTVSIIKDGGWHFSYMGGTQKIIEKLEAFAHTEFNTNEFKDKDRIMAQINEGKRIFDNGVLEFVKLDDSFPKYILDNQQRYAHLIKQDVPM